MHAITSDADAIPGIHGTELRRLLSAGQEVPGDKAVLGSGAIANGQISRRLAMVSVRRG